MILFISVLVCYHWFDPERQLYSIYTKIPPFRWRVDLFWLSLWSSSCQPISGIPYFLLLFSPYLCAMVERMQGRFFDVRVPLFGICEVDGFTFTSTSLTVTCVESLQGEACVSLMSSTSWESGENMLCYLTVIHWPGMALFKLETIWSNMVQLKYV